MPLEKVIVAVVPGLAMTENRTRTETSFVLAKTTAELPDTLPIVLSMINEWSKLHSAKIAKAIKKMARAFFMGFT